MHLFRLLFGEKTVEKIGYNLFVDSSNNSTQMAIIGFKAVFEESYFSDIKLLSYGAYRFPVPHAFDRVLSTIYGDYTSFPPEDKRYRKLFSEWVFRNDSLSIVNS